MFALQVSDGSRSRRRCHMQHYLSQVTYACTRQVSTQQVGKGRICVVTIACGFAIVGQGTPSCQDLILEEIEEMGFEGTTISSASPLKSNLRVYESLCQDVILEEIDEMGFEGQYDFFYLPMDVRSCLTLY